MLRSMYSGVSGLRCHQMKMDVIGNNIANVNTIGFKSSRVIFGDIYSQTLKNASLPIAVGGSNPQQVGLGVSINSVDVMHTRSGVQFTGALLDISIEGNGFFVVSDGDSNFFTRAGNFYTDKDNNLVTSTGLFVQSYNPVTGLTENITLPAEYTEISIDKNGAVVGVNKLTNSKDVIGQVYIANFTNQNSLEKIGDNLFMANVNSGTPEYNMPGVGGAPYLNPGSLEMSNVDLSKEFTDLIITQRGFQANSRVITASDQMLEELVNLKR